MIRTERLIIRLIESQDIEQVRKLHNHPETLKWLSDTHLVTKVEQESWFKKVSTSLTSRRYVVELRETKDLVGVFRLDDIDMANKSAYVGLDVSIDFRRKGFALETYEAMITFLFEELELNRLSLITLATNHSAVSLYEKLGFIKEGILRQAFYRGTEYVNGLIYSRLRNDS
jgi:RimJ/RimL family protein N-acetyltransferase